MKIEKLTVENMIAANHVDIKLTSPVTLICGSNEAGKSSICEGIKHALTGESTRVSLKKDYVHLVNDGSAVGFCHLEYDGGKEASITLPKGTHVMKEMLPDAIHYALDPELFARLSEDDRRRFVLSLSTTKADMNGVKAALIERGCDTGKVDQILPFLKSGFDNACKAAQDKAKDAKTSWRTTTGEAYGDKKAVEWKASKPEVDQDAAVVAKNAIVELDQELESVNQQLGAAQTQLNGAKNRNAEIVRLRDAAEKKERILRKLTSDRQEVAAWTVKVEDTKRLALGSSPGNIACTCPSCGTELIFNGKVLTERQGDLHGDEDAASKLPEYEATLKMFINSVNNGERDFSYALAAQEQLDKLKKESSKAPTDEEVVALKAKLDDIKAKRKQVQETLDSLNNNIKVAAEADAKTKKATDYHLDVQAWDHIAAALSPDGIPSELLATALQPINDRLSLSVQRTGWKPVLIDEDMTITYDGRPSRLSSKSAEWRTNAMIAEAISYVSGLKIIALDGFDILSLEGRGELIGWLDQLASTNEVDTALIFGTLKSLPSGLPDTIQAHWIEGGVIQDRAEAA